MKNFISKNPIIEKIVEGEAKEEILDLLLSKQLPFTEEEYLESLVFVARDEKRKGKAENLLKELSESTKLNYVEKSEANHQVADYIMMEALSLRNLQIVTRVIRNQMLPHELLLKIAEKGDLHMLEVLLDNQIKLIAYPEIIEVMEQNPEVNNFIRGKLAEIREFYLQPEEAEDIPVEEVLKDEDVKEVISREQQEEAGAGEEDGEDLEDLSSAEVEEKALTTLQAINRMSISERIKLALNGTKTHRLILVKDPNKMVALAVTESPKLTTDEVVMLARNKSVDTEIIARISKNREWIKNYPVILELVQNPKTPVKNALAFVKQLHLRDLKMVSRSKNVNPVVRNVAVNFYEQKTAPQKR